MPAGVRRRGSAAAGAPCRVGRPRSGHGALRSAPLLLVLAACQAGPRFTPEAARREVHGLVEGRRTEVPGLQGAFDPIAAERAARDLRDQPPGRLGLEAALSWAARGSREYRQALEQVHLAALAVTGARAAWRTQYGLGAGGEVGRSEDGTSVAGRADATMTQSLTAGGRFVLGLATDVLRNLTGNPLQAASSLLQSEWILPLGRGGGRLVALEPLRQAERDLLYALRDHVRFQQAFTLDIATRFYRTLELRDIERNETRTWESLKALVEEQTDKAASGRLPDYQVDQARQELLQAQDRRMRALAAYEGALDRFKLDLALPIEAELELDDGELEALRQREQVPAPFGLDHAVALGEERRLDLWNARERTQDACRHVLVARDALRAGVDLRIGADLTTPSTRPFAFDDAALDSLLGIDLDLPLERTAERNEVERRIVDVRRRRRDQQQLHDTIVFEIREAYRNLAEAARSIALQREGLRLAGRRVASTELLLERTATIRDLLDAEIARVAAANALTRALVDHVLVRLDLERAVGILAVDAQAGWEWTRPTPATEILPGEPAPLDTPATADPLGAAPAGALDDPRPEAAANRGAPPGVGSLMAAAEGRAPAPTPPPLLSSLLGGEPPAGRPEPPR